MRISCIRKRNQNQKRKILDLLIFFFSLFIAKCRCAQYNNTRTHIPRIPIRYIWRTRVNTEYTSAQSVLLLLWTTYNIYLPFTTHHAVYRGRYLVCNHFNRDCTECPTMYNRLYIPIDEALSRSPAPQKMRWCSAFRVLIVWYRSVSVETENTYKDILISAKEDEVHVLLCTCVYLLYTYSVLY